MFFPLSLRLQGYLPANFIRLEALSLRFQVLLAFFLCGTCGNEKWLKVMSFGIE